MNESLTEILRKKQSPSPGQPGIDWDERRDTYLASVEQLYRQVEGILAEAISTKTVTSRRRPKQLTENYIGTYAVDDLILLIGEEQVRFSPSGRNVAGAVGRVDVIGERGEATLLAQPGPRWGFVQSRQPTLRIVPFDESALTEILRLVMRD